MSLSLFNGSGSHRGGGGNSSGGRRGGSGYKETFSVSLRDGSGRKASVKAGTVSQVLAMQITVDCSYSMHGARINAAVAGVQSLYDVLRPSDLFGCTTFDSTVKNLHRLMPKTNVDIAKDIQNVLANCASGGSTAFYDAALEGIDRLHAAFNVDQFEHIVITDGGDNSSSASFGEVAAKVARPGLRNYQFVLIGVGLDSSTASRLRTLCQAAHCHLYLEPDTSALSRRLRSLADSFRIQLSLTAANGKTRTRTTDYRSKSAAMAAGGAAMQMLTAAAQQLSLGGGGGGGARALTSGRASGGGGGGGGGKSSSTFCRDNGNCTRGDACRFKHSKPVCNFDQVCKYKGTSCKFRHTR